MYSANGTGCRLMYIWSWSGPVTGSQTMPALRTSSSPGPRSTAPTRIGAPIASAAAADRGAPRPGCAAGRCRWSSPARPPGRACAACPAATRPASSTVALTWLSSTARRWALKSRPSRGTLPCTIATVHRRRRRRRRADRRPAAPTGDHRDRTRPAAAGTLAPDRRRRRHSRGDQQPAGDRDANVTSGAPPSTASRSAGASPWLNASRPHGNPPNGARSRSASCATQSSPVSSGHGPAAPVDQRGRARGQRRRAAQVTGLRRRTAAPRAASRCAGWSSSAAGRRTPARRAAEPGAGPQPAPVHGGGEQRHRDRCEPPQPVAAGTRAAGPGPAARAIGTAALAGSGRGAGGAGAGGTASTRVTIAHPCREGYGSRPSRSRAVSRRLYRNGCVATEIGA